MKTSLAALAALLFVGPPATAAECPGNPDALGVSRTIEIGTAEPLRLGYKTYPQSLALAPGEVVLTFDDGPLPSTTRMVLDALKHECVRATFFLIGRNAEAAPGLVKREIAEGHTVGHHTFSHPSVTLRGLPDAAARADIDRGFRADDLAGYGTFADTPRVPFFRFPGFADTVALREWLGQRHVAVFGADLWASDWEDMTPHATLDLLLGRLKREGKGIVLLHDIHHQTAAMLPQLLRELKLRGYKVVHMVPGVASPALADAPAGWRSETEETISKLWPKLPPPLQASRPPEPHRPPSAGQGDQPAHQ